jgi:hypothetical protein
MTAKEMMIASTTFKILSLSFLFTILSFLSDNHEIKGVKLKIISNCGMTVVNIMCQKDFINIHAHQCRVTA